MTECYKCGVSDENERLFDAISNKGVVKLCKSCANDENLPLVQPVDLNKPERTKSVYERLSSMANLDPEKHRRLMVENERQEEMRKHREGVDRRQNVSLKNVIDANFEKKKPQPRTDLVDNFHWVIMRMRRAKKLTQKQLAENIGEPELTVKNAEEGIILNNSDTLVRKLESYLGISLRRGESPYATQNTLSASRTGMNEDPARKELKEKFERGETSFDAKAAETLTISDLQEIKKKKEAEGGSKGGFFSFLKRSKKEETKSEEEKDLSEDEAENNEEKISKK